MLCVFVFIGFFFITVQGDDDDFSTRQLPTVKRPCNCYKDYLPAPDKDTSQMCECCNGNVLTSFGVKIAHKFCWEVWFKPENFEADMVVKHNTNVVMNRTLGGENPSPVCLPKMLLTRNYRPCARVHSMKVINGQMQMCLHMELISPKDSIVLVDFECYSCGRQRCGKITENEANLISANGTSLPTTNETTSGSLPATLPATTEKDLQNAELRAITYPCQCKEGTCSCCTGNVLQNFNFTMRNRVCAKLGYDPDDFKIELRLTFNDRTFLERRISGKNPPPLCMPIPYLSALRVCIRFSNIYFINRNVHTCLSLETQWNRETALAFNFDCIRLGVNGVALVKPEDAGGLPQPVVTSSPDTDGIPDYDENVGAVATTKRVTTVINKKQNITTTSTTAKSISLDSSTTRPTQSIITSSRLTTTSTLEVSENILNQTKT